MRKCTTSNMIQASSKGIDKEVNVVSQRGREKMTNDRYIPNDDSSIRMIWGYPQTCLMDYVISRDRSKYIQKTGHDRWENRQSKIFRFACDKDEGNKQGDHCWRPQICGFQYDRTWCQMKIIRKEMRYHAGENGHNFYP